jgi:hypothetical protein
MVSQALERSRLQLPILKVRSGAVVEAVFCDSGPLWFAAHWVNGRQVLCAGMDQADCPLCGVNQSRVLGMTIVALRVQAASRAFLLEVSPLAFSSFEARCSLAGMPLAEGVLCAISRPRARGCLRIEPYAVVGVGEHWLDGERRLLGGWAVLCGLPLPLLNETSVEFQRRVVAVVQARARLAEAAVRK